MSVIVRCIEPDARPPVLESRLQRGESLAIHALLDEAEGLRFTVLRPLGAAAPRGAVLLMELDIAEGRNGAALRLRRTGPEAQIEWLRTDSRGRATATVVARGQDLRGGGQFEAQLPDRRRLSFTLDLDEEERVGARMAVSGAGARGAQAVMRTRGALWVVPGLWSLLIDADDVVKANLQALGARFGLSTRTMVWLISGAFAVASAGALWYAQYQAAGEAKAQAEAAEASAATAGATRDAALRGEAACLNERATLAQRLGERDEQRRILAENALQLTATRTQAAQLGGPTMEGKALAAVDAEVGDHLVRRVANDLVRMGAPSPDAARCLAFGTLLDPGTPTLLLLWHPDPALSCPQDYSAAVGIVSLAGRWGLSERVAAEFASPGFGGEEDGVVSDDPRFVDRWSVETLLRAYTQARTTLLTHDLHGRPAVAPSESGLWALAILGAYDRMASPAGGVLDDTLDTCVSTWLDEAAAAAPPAEAGRPLLPELLSVADETVSVPMSPSPGCPWTDGALTSGARAALAAAARQAAALGAAKEE